MQDSLVVLALTGAIFVAAGVVKGVLGMGLPTVAIGFLGLVIAPVEAAAMLVLPSLITNIWQLIAGPNFRALSKRFGTLLLGICLGTPFGVSFITSGNTQIGSSSGLRIACRNAAVMSYVTKRHCMLSEKPMQFVTIRRTGVDAIVSTKSLIQCLNPLTQSRLLMTTTF